MGSSIKSDFMLYRRLLRYVLPYWRIFVLSTAGMVFLAITDPAIPALIKPLLNGAFIEKDPATITLIPVLFVGLFLLRGVASYVAHTALNWVAHKVIMDLRLAMFERFIDYPTSFFDVHRSGGFMSRFTYDVTQIKEASTNALTTLVRDSVSVVGLLAWMFYIDWVLALICMIGAPVMGGIISIIRKRLRKMSRYVQDTMGDIHHVIAECFDAQKIIKLYGGREVEKQRFYNTVNAHRRFSMKFVMAATATSPAIQIITAIILSFIMYLSTYDPTDTVLVGDFVSFFTATAMLLGPLKRLAGVNEHLQKGLAACESVFGLLDAGIESLSGKKELVNPRGSVVFNDVSYKYKDAEKNAVDAISFKINPGETVALVGESGSGKTTLANLLPRFYEIQSGTIYYDDMDIRQLSLDGLRKNIAYVSQDVILFNDTIRNNIAYGDLNDVSDEKIWAAAEAAYATEFINEMPGKMSAVVGEDGTRLSGGQRQRLAIARALLKDARLLILDEATSSLDPRSERHIQSALENVSKGRTCLIIAHRLSTIENASRIIVMNRGKIVEQGKHEDLLKLQNYYARLYRTQFGEKSGTGG